MKIHKHSIITLEFPLVYYSEFQWLNIGSIFDINISNP